MNDIPSRPVPNHFGQMMAESEAADWEGMCVKGTGSLSLLMPALWGVDVLWPCLVSPQWQGGGAREGALGWLQGLAAFSFCERMELSLCLYGFVAWVGSCGHFH